MKIFRQWALIAILVGTCQANASEVTPSTWQLPKRVDSQVSVLTPMSDSELSAIEGGAYFGRLTENQILMTVVGNTALVVSGIANVFITVGHLRVATGVLDVLLCKAGARIPANFLSQSQVSAGAVDNRILGYSDAGVGLGYGVVFSLLSTGCTATLAVIDHRTASVDKEANEILDKKKTKLNNAGSPGNRKLLTDKWAEQDRWFKWALDNAQGNRDSVEKDIAYIREITALRNNLCWATGIYYFSCIRNYNADIDLAKRSIDTHITAMKGDLYSLGKADLEHAKSIGVAIPRVDSTHQLTYEIN